MIIIYFLKFIIFLLRTFTGNSGTALPGLWLEKYFPRTAKKLLSVFDKVILITGTNGKTTTTQMICYLLEKHGIRYVTNKSGSNLVRGILSSVLVEWDGEPAEGGFAVFEVEEGSMPKLTKMVNADYIVVTNIFRDQLDAYGEIDKTLKYIRQAIENSENPILLLNGDDSRVFSLGSYSANKKFAIRLDQRYLNQIKFEDQLLAAEVPGFELVKINDVRIYEDLSSSYKYTIKDNTFEGRTIVPGLHNVINAVYAEVVVNEAFNGEVNTDLSGFQPAFGRGEIIEVPQNLSNTHKTSSLDSRLPPSLKLRGTGRGNDKKVLQFQILLAKNPAGLNLNLHLLENVKNRDAVLLILNDKIADGRDISWIWDVDFSILKKLGFKNIYVTGTRRFDMALRLKYEHIHITEIFESIEESVTILTKKDAQKVFVLPTYTAMREFRDELAKYTEVKKMYE